MEGSRLGPYRLERELGAGGMATVYLGIPEEEEGLAPGVAVGSPVAIKVVHSHLLTTPGFFERFVREIEVGRSINHENVVRTYDARALKEEEGSANYMVMEYVEGQTLRGLLEELGWVPEDLCRHIGREVSKALTAIHGAGIIHRDLKPENVLITSENVVKVMDLGVAKLQDEALKLSQTGQFVGSVMYAAPEQFKGTEGGLDGRIDLYSLGLTLYELASGVNPFRDDNLAAVIRRQLTEEAKPLSALNTQVSPFFEEVIARLMQKERRERFRDAGDLLAALEEGEDSEWWHVRVVEIRASTKRPLRRVRIPRETALYGRDGEIEALGNIWSQVKEGEGQTVLVGGEAGIGKTRLIDEFAAMLEKDGEDFHFLFGSFPPGGAATASGAFNTAYREHFGAESLEDRLYEYLKATPALVPAFAAFLRGEPPPAGEQPLTKESIQTLFVHATRALASERPVIVLIDDLHFAPEEGRALFAALALAVSGHRIMLVGTTRPEIPESWRQQVETLERVTRLEVGRLGRDILVPLLTDTFRSGPLVSRLAPLIHAKTDGNPFFVFEVVRGLREGQFLKRSDDGTWVATQAITNIQIPSSVKELVAARISDLSEEERDLLDVAACCGFDFDPLLVGEALGLGRIPTLKKLGRLEKSHRLVRSHGRRYVFDHHQVQEVLYEGLSELLREEYHSALGETLEDLSGAADQDPEEVEGGLAVDLAEHYLKGARDDRAGSWVAPALTHLEQGYRNERLIELADRALDMRRLLKAEGRVDVLLRKSGALDLLGFREEQRQSLEEAVKLSDETGNPRLRSTSRRQLGVLDWVLTKYDQAEVLLREALELASESGDGTGEASATGSLANVFLRAGKYDEAKERYESQLEIARSIGDRTEEGRATNNLGILAWRLGDDGEATRRYEQYMEIAKELGDKRGEANAAGNIGIVHHHRHRPEEARTWVERQLTLAHEMGDRRAEGMASGTLGLVLMDLGQLADARLAFAHHQEIAREIGDRRGEGMATGNLGLLYKKMGRFEEARECHARHAELAAATGDPRAEGTALLSLATVLMKLSRMAEAKEIFDRQLAIALESRDIGGQLIGNVNSGQLLITLGEFEVARERLGTALQLGEKYDVAEVIGATLDWLAVIEEADGDREGARVALDRALAVHQEAGAKSGEVESLLALGRLALSGNDAEAAVGHFHAAHAAAEEVEEPGLKTVALCRLASLRQASETEAREEFEQNQLLLEPLHRMESQWALYLASQASRDREDAIRVLEDLIENAPEECHDAMRTRVPLHREILGT